MKDKMETKITHELNSYNVTTYDASNEIIIITYNF